MALSSKRKISIFIVVLLGFIGFLVAGLNSQQFGPQSTPVVRAFPAMAVELLNGNNDVQTRQLFYNDYQLVNVWASWCGVCKQEHAYLNLLEKSGVPIVGLNYRDQRSGALNYLGHLGNPYREVIFDPKGRLALDLGVVGTPETYLVTKQGDIIYKHLGVLNERVWNKYFAQYFQLGES